MNEEVKHQITTDAAEPAPQQPVADTPETGSVETTAAELEKQYQEQLEYAQKLLQVLQGKLNEVTGINIQLEAKNQIADEKLKKAGLN